MASAQVVTSNKAIKLSNERVLVVGGTQGIGAAVAVRFAQAGADVWIAGRSAERGAAMVEKLKQAGADGEPRFFQADLSKHSEMRRLAADVAAAAEARGIDHLIMTQGGPPAGGLLSPTREGIRTHFAVQYASRAVLLNALALDAHVVKKSAMAIATAGKWRTAFDADDIALEKVNPNVLYIEAHCCSVIDCVIADARARRTEVQFTHLHPGVVNTDALSTAGASAVITWMMRKFAQDAAAYAEVPFYLTANPDGVARVAKEGPCWNHKIVPVRISPHAADAAVRKKVLDALLKDNE